MEGYIRNRNKRNKHIIQLKQRPLVVNQRPILASPTNNSLLTFHTKKNSTFFFFNFSFDWRWMISQGIHHPRLPHLHPHHCQSLPIILSFQLLCPLLSPNLSRSSPSGNTYLFLTWVLWFRLVLNFGIWVWSFLV